MTNIKWGIIGCGDVTEVKSGPAFSKVGNSSLVAVMRRDAAKAADYARRHHVPRWYSSARELISDTEVNAVYIATPPDSHEQFVLDCCTAGKNVYVEKPMTLNVASARRMTDAADKAGVKLCVAHYRRAQPRFLAIKKLIEEGTIGNIRFVRIVLAYKALTKQQLEIPKTAWRVDATVSGGGLFHDLSPHQLDILLFLFGSAEQLSGIVTNQAGIYSAPDCVVASGKFPENILFTGIWNFTLGEGVEEEYCEIVGESGMIRFAFFNQEPITVTTGSGTQILSFDQLTHVQQPLIERIVEYFSGGEVNPCSGEDGVAVMQMIEDISNN